MATTYQDTTGNGSNKVFNFGFPYLKDADVKVQINQVQIASTEYAVSTGPTKITFNNNSITSAVQETDGSPKTGLIVRVYRDTEVDAAKAVFAAGSSIRASDLNNNQDQFLYAAQEQQNLPVSKWQIQADAIDGTKLADDSINSEHIVDGSVDRVHLAADIVDGTKIDDNSIDSEHYVDGSIDVEHLADNSVDRASLVADVIDGTKIEDNAVNTEHIANEAITSAKIANATIQAADIANDAISATQIGSGAITKPKLGADCIDGTKIEDNAVDNEHLADDSVRADQIKDGEITAAKLATGTLDSRYYTETELNAGQLDSRYYTETELNAGQLDSRYYTETEVDANFYKVGSAAEIASGESWSSSDTKVATTAAIDARITDLVDDVGGFVPIANETSFPTANPDVNNGAGTLVSIKALANNLVSNGSGVATIANAAGSNTVTINGLANSTTYAATFGMIVETTTTLHTYAFHRSTPKATEVTTVAGSIANVNTAATNIANINTVASDLNEGTSEIDTVATNITNVNNVGNAITNVNAVATNITGVHHYADVYQVATSAPTARADSSSLEAGDMWFDSSSNKELKVHNGTAYQLVTPSQSVLDDIAIVSGNITYAEDLGLITESVSTGTGNSIETCADNISKIQALGTTAAVADMAILGTTDVVADLAILGTTDVVADLNTLGTSDVVSDMNTLATSGNVTAMDNCSGSIANINTVAGSIANVNRYADEYLIQSGTPSSPSAGDLWYNSTANTLNYYNGSSWVGIAPGISAVLSDTSPALGGHLDCNDKNLTEVATISGDNLQIDFGSIA